MDAFMLAAVKKLILWDKSTDDDQNREYIRLVGGGKKQGTAQNKGEVKEASGEKRSCKEKEKGLEKKREVKQKKRKEDK